MSRNCIKCGAEIGDLEVFCPKCGTVQNGSSISVGENANSAKKVNESKSSSSIRKYIISAVGIIALVVIGLFIIGSVNHDRKSVHKETAQAPITASTTASNTQDGKSAQTAPANSTNDKAEQELWKKGVQGAVLASSIGHNGSGYLSLVKNNNNQYQIITFDTKNDRIGITPYEKNLLYFTNRKPKGDGHESVIFNMTILHDSADRDSGAGAWENGNHNLPIFANYKFDGAGNIVPGMLTTGKGTKPSHYQGYFNEQRNVDIINLFLTEMMALQKNIADNKVVLP